MNLRVEYSCRQRSAEDRSGIQADLVALEERTPFSLGGMPEHDDTSIKVSAVRQERFADPEPGVNRPAFRFPGRTGRQQSGMNEVITRCDILHLRGPQELPVGRWNRFQPECEGGLEVG